MTQPIWGIERPLRSIEDFVSTLRSASHRFVDVFFDGWKTTALCAFAGALGGVIFPNEFKNEIALLTLLAAIVAGIILAAVRSDKKRLAVILFLVRLCIGLAFMAACSPAAFQQLRNSQQTSQPEPLVPVPNSASK